jgi:two-component system chemotaxis response regulator CheY
MPDVPSNNKKRIVALVGHCGPDSSYLRMAVQSSVRDAQVVMADDETDLTRLVTQGVDLLLMNRELDWGFASRMGVDLIKRLRADHPELKMMLVSNYPDAQAEAQAAGAVPGFGKREIGSARVKEVLRSALGDRA